MTNSTPDSRQNLATNLADLGLRLLQFGSCLYECSSSLGYMLPGPMPTSFWFDQLETVGLQLLQVAAYMNPALAQDDSPFSEKAVGWHSTRDFLGISTAATSGASIQGRAGGMVPPANLKAYLDIADEVTSMMGIAFAGVDDEWAAGIAEQSFSIEGARRRQLTAAADDLAGAVIDGLREITNQILDLRESIGSLLSRNGAAVVSLTTQLAPGEMG